MSSKEPAPVPLPETADHNTNRAIRAMQIQLEMAEKDGGYVNMKRKHARAITAHLTDLTRRLAEAEARLEFYQGLAKERHDREVACIARAESAEARVRELEAESILEREAVLVLADRVDALQRALFDEQQAHQQTTRVMAERVQELEAFIRTYGCYTCRHAGACPLSDSNAAAVLNGGPCGGWELKDLRSALAATEVKP